jgi:hypothetical protein
MGEFKVYYNPEISDEAEIAIRADVNCSMVSVDETTFQYSIDKCTEALIQRELNEDVKILRNLKVDYIEF